jgi:hypothetical protein
LWIATLSATSTSVPASCAITLKRVRLSATGGWIPGGTLDSDLWGVTLSATGYGGPSTLEADLWPVEVYATGVGQTTYTLAISTKDGSVTSYSNHSFNSYFEMNGRFFGVSSSGIYELTGSTDSGTAINASFTTGYVKGKKSISPNDIYMYLKSTGDVDVRTVVDNITGAKYTAPTTSNQFMPKKLNLGKGRVGSMVGLNVSSSDSMEVSHMTLTVDEKTYQAPHRESWLNGVLNMVTIEAND